VAVERYPLTPLLECTSISARALAAAAGMDPAHVRRLVARGEVNEWQADRLAIGVGLHPAIIWPEWLTANMPARRRRRPRRAGPTSPKAAA
jgi:hypothetical protein